MSENESQSSTKKSKKQRKRERKAREAAKIQTTVEKSKLKVLFPDILRNRAFGISVGKDNAGGFFKEFTEIAFRHKDKIGNLFQ